MLDVLCSWMSCLVNITHQIQVHPSFDLMEVTLPVQFLAKSPVSLCGVLVVDTCSNLATSVSVLLVLLMYFFVLIKKSFVTVNACL